MADYPVSIDLVRRKLLEMRDGMEPTAIAVLNMALSKLEGFPAMDVVPVVHGKWETQGRDATCSVCKYIQIGAYRVTWHSPYCPSCGAKMDAKEVEADGRDNQND